MADWRRNPGAISGSDGTDGRLPKLKSTRRETAEAEQQKRTAAAQAPKALEPNPVRSEADGSRKRPACADEGMKQSKGKGLLIDLNEAAEDIAPAPPVAAVQAPAGALAPMLKTVKGFDLNMESDEKAEEMEEERHHDLAGLGLPVRVMQNLGGPTGTAPADGSPAGGKRPRPRVLFAPMVPPAPIPQLPRRCFAPSPSHPYIPSRLIRVAVNLRAERNLWLTGTLWRYDIPLQIWLICCDCHSNWMLSSDFFNHAGWSSIKDPHKYFVKLGQLAAHD